MIKKAENNYSIERWTLDRIDWDSVMTRIVLVPIKKEYLNESKIKKFLENKTDDSKDDLKLWDLQNSQIKKMTISKLANILNVPNANVNILSENMVFWIIYSKDKKENVKVFHKTGAARQLTKKLYNQVLRKDGGPHETK